MACKFRAKYTTLSMKTGIASMTGKTLNKVIKTT